MGLFDFFKGNKKQDKENPVAKTEVKSVPVSWSVWPEQVDNVTESLNREIETARSQGLRVLMYTYAVWSPGSVGFKNAREDRQCSELLRGKVHVVEIHFDTLNQMNEIGFPGYSIPQLWLLEADGTYAGVTATGGAWGEDTPENIHRFLDGWLSSQGIK